MIDLLNEIQSGSNDLGLWNSDAEKAGNILSVQLGSLEYAPDFGIDLSFFLSPDFKFQNDSFKTYLISVLSNSSINVASLTETIEAIYSQYTFNLSNQSGSSSLIAR